MPEEITPFFEDVFRRLSGKSEIDYKTTISYIGREASVFTSEGGIGSSTMLLKAFSGEQKAKKYREEARFSQMKPEGEILCLQYSTYYYPPKESIPRTKVKTRIGVGENYNIKTFGQKIDEFIATQKAAKILLEEREAEIMGVALNSLCLQSNNSRSSVISDGIRFGLSFSNGQTDKKPAIKLSGSDGNFRAVIKGTDDYQNVFGPLDLQIEKFQGLKEK